MVRKNRGWAIAVPDDAIRDAADGLARRVGVFAEFSRAIKNAVSIPVILTGGVTEPEHAARLLAAGRADLIGVGRAILKDSGWAQRAVQEA
jgi:2,4-dienoyl-CoA reductase-like NADH-dependent reductase (Old Yellow Enzyme family)